MEEAQAKHALGERDVNTREEGSAKVEKASALGGQAFEPDSSVEGILRSEQVNAASEKANVDAMDRIQADLGFDFQPEAQRPPWTLGKWFRCVSAAASGMEKLLKSGELKACSPDIELNSLLDWMRRSITRRVTEIKAIYSTGGGWTTDKRIWVPPGAPNEPAPCQSGPHRGLYQIVPHARIDPGTGKVTVLPTPRNVRSEVVTEALQTIRRKMATGEETVVVKRDRGVDFRARQEHTLAAMGAKHLTYVTGPLKGPQGRDSSQDHQPPQDQRLSQDHRPPQDHRTSHEQRCVVPGEPSRPIQASGSISVSSGAPSISAAAGSLAQPSNAAPAPSQSLCNVGAASAGGHGAHESPSEIARRGVAEGRAQGTAASPSCGRVSGPVLVFPSPVSATARHAPAPDDAVARRGQAASGSGATPSHTSGAAGVGAWPAAGGGASCAGAKSGGPWGSNLGLEEEEDDDMAVDSSQKAPKSGPGGGPTAAASNAGLGSGVGSGAAVGRDGKGGADGGAAGAGRGRVAAGGGEEDVDMEVGVMGVLMGQHEDTEGCDRPSNVVQARGATLFVGHAHARLVAPPPVRQGDQGWTAAAAAVVEKGRERVTKGVKPAQEAPVLELTAQAIDSSPSAGQTSHESKLPPLSAAQNRVMFALSNQLARGAYESISKDELFETLKHRMGKETGFNLMRRDFDAVIEWAEESCLLMVDSEGLLWPTIG